MALGGESSFYFEPKMSAHCPLVLVQLEKHCQGFNSVNGAGLHACMRGGSKSQFSSRTHKNLPSVRPSIRRAHPVRMIQWLDPQEIGLSSLLAAA